MRGRQLPAVVEPRVLAVSSAGSKSRDSIDRRGTQQSTSRASVAPPMRPGLLRPVRLSPSHGLQMRHGRGSVCSSMSRAQSMLGPDQSSTQGVAVGRSETVHGHNVGLLEGWPPTRHLPLGRRGPERRHCLVPAVRLDRLLVSRDPLMAVFLEGGVPMRGLKKHAIKNVGLLG